MFYDIFRLSSNRFSRYQDIHNINDFPPGWKEPIFGSGICGGGDTLFVTGHCTTGHSC